jgi:hypothetical protein
MVKLFCVSSPQKEAETILLSRSAQNPAWVNLVSKQRQLCSGCADGFFGLYFFFQFVGGISASVRGTGHLFQAILGWQRDSGSISLLLIDQNTPRPKNFVVRFAATLLWKEFFS